MFLMLCVPGVRLRDSATQPREKLLLGRVSPLDVQ